MYDIAIIGAGPAGATLARLLDARFHTIVIDKKQTSLNNGYQKPCGGLLAPDAQKSLARFGMTLPLNIMVDPQIFSVRTIDVSTAKTRHYQRYYINLDRHRFDLWLKAQIPPHVETRHDCTVKKLEQTSNGWCITLRTNGATLMENINARYIMGADGAASLVRRGLYPKNKMRIYKALQQWFPNEHKTPFYSCIFDAVSTDCYAWGLTKNQYFIFGGAFAPKGAAASFTALKTRLAPFGFMLEHPLKTEACMVIRPEPFKFCTGRNGAFLLGEAAGFVSPSSLEGISYAFDSAWELANVFNNGARDLNRAYHQKTLKIQLKLFCKNLKSPFIYHPTLRRLVMQSGIGKISVV